MISNLLLCALISASGFGAGRTDGALQTELKDGSFTATLKDGFHFNERAPNSVALDEKTVKPSQISSRTIQFASLPEYKNGQASLFICDDDVTFCETKTISLKGKAPKIEKPKDSQVFSAKPNKHGFIVDDYNSALSLAKKKNQLLLIDFSARWCPGCVRLEGEIFPTAEFKNMTGEFVKLKIDVDRFQNAVLSEKFHIKGIPSLIVITADQEEVDRIYDYQPIEVIGKFIAGIKADPSPLRVLIEKAQAKDQDVLLLLGKRLLMAERANEAVTYLEQVKPAPPELLDAKIKGSSNGQAELRSSIQAEPGSIRSIGWRTELAGLTKKTEEKQKLKAEGLAVADDLLAHPEKIPAASSIYEIGEFTGFEPLMIAMARAELVEAAGPAVEADAAWKKAAQVGLDLKIPPKVVGVSMRHLVVLNRAKFVAQADELSRRLLKLEPNNAELQRRRLAILVELKKYSEAIKLGQKVVKNSYGRNEFWAAQTLAKAYVNADKRKEARDFIGKYLSRNEMDWPNMKDTRKAFEDLLNKVPKG